MIDPEASFARCLVTGASGFIGTRYLQRLAATDRARHVPMVRRAEAAAPFRTIGFAPAVGDLLNASRVDAALSGCDAVVHLAHGGNGPEATRLLVQRSAAAGVRRFVHVSSMAVHGPAPGPDATREDTATIRRYGHDYSDSKAEQEEIVQAAADRGDLPAVILRPTIVYGPASHFVLLIMEEARHGVVHLVDDGVGICNIVYVDDVCSAIDRALRRPAAVGLPMFVTGDESITWHRFISTFASMIHPAPRFENLSSAAALRYWEENPERPPATGLVPRLARKVARLLGGPPPPPPWPPLGRIQRETVRVTFSNARAKHVLGWSPDVDFDAGAALTRTWLAQSGHLR